MRRPSLRCTPNRVTIRRVVAWTPDAVLGRVPSYGSDSSSEWICAVQPASAADVTLHSRESHIVTHVAIFHDDPNVKPNDEITWLDHGNRTLSVVGVVSTSAGRARSWRVMCEEQT